MKVKVKHRESLAERSGHSLHLDQLFHDSTQLPRFAPSVVSTHRSAAVVKCNFGLHVPSVCGQSGGCTHAAGLGCRRGHQDLRDSAGDIDLQDGSRTSSHFRRPP